MGPGGSSVLMLYFSMSELLLNESHPQTKFKWLLGCSSEERLLEELVQPVLYYCGDFVVIPTWSTISASPHGLSHSEQVTQVEAAGQKYWLCCIELLQLGVKGRDALACVERCSMEILMIEQCQIEVVPLRDLIALTFIGDPSVWLLFGLWERFLGLTPAFYTKLIFPYELVSLSIRKFTLWRTKITWTIFRTISESKSCGSDHRADRKSRFIYLFLVNLGAVFKFKLGCDRKNSGLLRSKSQEGYVSVFCTARCASMSFLKNIYMVFV